MARTLEQLSSARNDFNIGLRLNIPLGQIAREQPEVQATVDMRTVVLVGSSQTRVVEDARGRRWTYTPRSHPG